MYFQSQKNIKYGSKYFFHLCFTCLVFWEQNYLFLNYFLYHKCFTWRVKKRNITCDLIIHAWRTKSCSCSDPPVFPPRLRCCRFIVVFRLVVSEDDYNRCENRSVVLWALLRWSDLHGCNIKTVYLAQLCLICSAACRLSEESGGDARSCWNNMKALRYLDISGSVLTGSFEGNETSRSHLAKTHLDLVALLPFEQ